MADWAQYFGAHPLHTTVYSPSEVEDMTITLVMDYRTRLYAKVFDTVPLDLALQLQLNAAVVSALGGEFEVPGRKQWEKLSAENVDKEELETARARLLEHSAVAYLSE